jgi:hypothetical protein
MPGSDLFPPYDYGWLGWLALPAFALLLTAWLLLAAYLRRRKLALAAAPAVAAPAPVARPAEHPAAAALRRIAAIERGVEVGDLSVREAYLELSATVREFALARRGIDAPRMTLTDIERIHERWLAEVIGDWYPAAFAPQELSDARRAIAEARRVVDRWTY